jgi:peroxiredoxin
MNDHRRDGRVGRLSRWRVVLLAGGMIGLGLVLVLVAGPLASTAPRVVPSLGASGGVSSHSSLLPDSSGTLLGQVAPELTGQTNGRAVSAVDLDGHPIKLAGLRGRATWIVFWSSTCPPCQQEMPALRQVFDEYRARGLAMLAISVHEPSADTVRAYAQENGLDFMVALDPTSAVFNTFGGNLLPTHFFLDSGGVVRGVHMGPLGRGEAENILGPLLSH